MNRDDWETSKETCHFCDKSKSIFYKCKHCWGIGVCSDCVQNVDGKPACPDCLRKSKNLCKTCGVVEKNKGCTYFNCADCGEVVCYDCSYYQGTRQYDKTERPAYCPACFVKKDMPAAEKASYVLSKHLHCHGYSIVGMSGHSQTIDWDAAYNQLGFLISPTERKE